MANDKVWGERVAAWRASGLTAKEFTAAQPFSPQQIDHETIVQLIGSVRTSTGLSVRSKLDVRTYQTGLTVSDAQMGQLNIVAAAFHRECNYTIKPTRPQCR